MKSYALKIRLKNNINTLLSLQTTEITKSMFKNKYISV